MACGSLFGCEYGREEMVGIFQTPVVVGAFLSYLETVPGEYPRYLATSLTFFPL